MWQPVGGERPASNKPQSEKIKVNTTLIIVRFNFHGCKDLQMTMIMTMILTITMTRDEGNVPISNTATPANIWNRPNNEAGEHIVMVPRIG